MRYTFLSIVISTAGDPRRTRIERDRYYIVSRGLMLEGGDWKQSLACGTVQARPTSRPHFQAASARSLAINPLCSIAQINQLESHHILHADTYGIPIVGPVVMMQTARNDALTFKQVKTKRKSGRRQSWNGEARCCATVYRVW